MNSAPGDFHEKEEDDTTSATVGDVDKNVTDVTEEEESSSALRGSTGSISSLKRAALAEGNVISGAVAPEGEFVVDPGASPVSPDNQRPPAFSGATTGELYRSKLREKKQHASHAPPMPPPSSPQTSSASHQHYKKNPRTKRSDKKDNLSASADSKSLALSANSLEPFDDVSAFSVASPPPPVGAIRVGDQDETYVVGSDVSTLAMNSAQSQHVAVEATRVHLDVVVAAVEPAPPPLTQGQQDELQNLTHELRDLVHQQRKKNEDGLCSRRGRVILVAALLFGAMVVGAVVAAVLLTRNNNNNNNNISAAGVGSSPANTTMTSIPSLSPTPSPTTPAPTTMMPTVFIGNRHPMARCQPDTVVVNVGRSCALETSEMLSSVLDNGSSDPDANDTITFSFSPTGPYEVGLHDVTLIVRDSEGLTDTCLGRIHVVDDGDGWKFFRNHAYRFRFCEADWNAANRRASATTIRNANCGGFQQAHLATITSQEERDFIVSFQQGNLWLGANQPANLRENNEPRGGWTWVNDEGLVFDGYTDWDSGEPNNGGGREHCMVLLEAGRGFQWDDRPCDSEDGFIEELDIDANIIIGGCDTGIPDILLDLEECNTLITAQLATCNGGDSGNDNLNNTCVQEVLDMLVQEGSISFQESLQIEFCGIENEPPQAQCKSTVVKQLESPGCDGSVTIDVTDLDAGSSDPDGDDIFFRISQEESTFGVGSHVVEMIVFDDRGGSSKCQSTLVVTDNAMLSTTWTRSGGSTYRLRLCSVDWFLASQASMTSSECGQTSHLATINSRKENDFLFQSYGRNYWLGGFQPPDTPEPDGNWTWVNDEGLIFDAFTNWRGGRPNENRGEDCLYVSNNGRWDDSSCSNSRTFVEEINLLGHIMVMGCDSGVQDIFRPGDTLSCDGYIQEAGVGECSALFSNLEDFRTCLKAFLGDLVKDGLLSNADKNAIVYCGSDNFPPVAQCRQEIQLLSGGNCSGAMLNVLDLDDGSFDPEGDPLVFSASQSGLLSVGVHNITLTVNDGIGGQDECVVLVTVKNDDVNGNEGLSWQFFENHAYRVQDCATDWLSASILSSSSSLCNAEAHLVTITSGQESNFVSSLLNGSETFIGAFQLSNETEPDQGWTWVNEEGLLNSTFENWSVDEPRDLDGTSGCAATNRDGQWSAVSCQNQLVYVEEIDFDATVVFMDCDTGVADIFDPSSCSGTIAQRLGECNDLQDSANVSTCVVDTLSDLSDEGLLTAAEVDAIANCGNSTNQPPVARCKSQVVKVTGAGCSSRALIEAEDLNDGSFDPDGDSLTLSLSRPGPFSFGVNEITLTVRDLRGGSDSCTSTVLFVDDGISSSTQWLLRPDGNAAYRIRFCESDWGGANRIAANDVQCGARAHLATITSEEERNFIRGLRQGGLWIGGFQPEGSAEPDGGWTWVNNEGLVFDGYTDWDGGEPNNGGGREHCMVFLEARRGFQWDDRPCNSEDGFIQEVKTARTFVMNGCDSGVLDPIMDINSCTFMIEDRIIDQCTPQDASPNFTECARAGLDELVSSQLLSEAQAQSVATCAGIEFVSS